MTVIKSNGKGFLFLIFLFLLSVLTNAQVLQNRKVILMGSKFEIGVVAMDSITAHRFIDTAIAEISRIEFLISTWMPETEISKVNANAGMAPVKVNREVFELTKRAIEYSKLTDGAFDISFAAMDKIWRFDGEMDSVPSPEDVKYAVRNVGYQNIILDTFLQTIFLPKKGMKIDFGSIGKSYGAEKARAVLKSKGVQAGIINASGDICTWGTQPNGSAWTIGVANPFNLSKKLGVLKFNEWAVVTSGSYEKFVLLEGKRYNHIINPKTGYPSKGITSVTVVGANAEVANALSTATMVMGYKRAKQLFKKFQGYDYIIISDHKKRFFSKGVKLLNKN